MMKTILKRSGFRTFVFIGIFFILYNYARIYAAAMPDDSFITLTFAKNLMRSGTWGFIPGETINTSTSPLNTGALAIGLTIFADPVRAVAAYTAALWFVSGLLLWRLGGIAARNRIIFTWAAMCGLLTNPFLLSATGLESWLSIALVIAAAICLLEGRWLLLGFALGFLTLSRIDYAIVLMISMFYIPQNGFRIRCLGGFAATVAPWYLFSWLALGSLLPETLFIKTAQKTFDGNGFYNGILMYFRQDWLSAAASFIYAIFIPVLLKTGRGREGPLVGFVALLAVVHYAAYSILRVPPYYWYYTPQIVALILLGSLAVSAIPDRFAKIRFILPILPAVLFGWVLFANPRPLESPLIKSNWATLREYREMGVWLKEHVPPETEIDAMWELGTLSYYSERKLCNPFSSRADLFELIENTLKPGGVKRFIVNFNYLFLKERPHRKVREHRFMYLPATEPLPAGMIMRWPAVSSWRGEGSFVYFREPAD